MSFSNGQNVQAADLNNFSVTSVTTTGDVTVGDDLIVTDDAGITGDCTVGATLVVTTSVQGAGVYLSPKVVALTDGASVAVDAALGTVFRLTAAGNRTILAPSNAVDGQKMILRHTASGADRTLALTTGSSGAFRFGTDITALSATTSAKTDYIGCVYNGTDSRWDVVAYVKGY